MKKRMYPSTIRIGKQVYSVAWAKTVDKDPTTRGTCDSVVKQITLRNNMSEKETFETFIHECLHAITDENKGTLTHGQIEALEETLASFLRDNFHLFSKR